MKPDSRNTKLYEEYLERLIRRRNHLASRVINSTEHLSYDEAELAALNWVITFCHEHPHYALDHLEEYLKKGLA